MSGISFLSDNHVDNATVTVTSGTINAQYPVANLKNESPSIKVQSTGTTLTILIDQTTTRAVDSLSLVGDPTGNLGLITAVFKNSTTTDFSLSTPINLTLSSEHNMGLDFITEVSGRYWQVELTGATYAEVGNIFIGKRTNLAQNSVSIASFKYSHTDKSTVKMNEYGQRFINSRNLVKSIGGNIEYCTQDETETLDDMFLYHGQTKPLWVILDKDSQAMNDGEFRLSMYGYITKMPKWSASGGQTYNTGISIQEAI